LPEPVFWSVPMVRLYREDVAALIEIFQRADGEVIVQVGPYALDEPGELPSIPLETTSTLKIERFAPHVSLELRPSGGRLYAKASDGPIARGLADEARQLLVSKRDRGRKALTVIGNVTPALTLVSALLAAGAFWSGESVTGAALTAVAVLLAGFSWWAFREALNRHGRIVLKSQAEAPGFFRRNGDNIILAVASMILGGVFAKVFGL
jgi:hypothetical protein